MLILDEMSTYCNSDFANLASMVRSLDRDAAIQELLRNISKDNILDVINNNFFVFFSDENILSVFRNSQVKLDVWHTSIDLSEVDSKSKHKLFSFIIKTLHNSDPLSAISHYPDKISEEMMSIFSDA